MALEKSVPPPPATRGKYDWDGIAVELRANPQEWFLIAEMPYGGMVTHLRNGVVKAFRDGVFEFEGRSSGRGAGEKPVWRIWGRFMQGEK